MIDDLFDMTRIVQGKLSIFPEELDMHALIGEMVEFFRDDRERLGLDLSVELTASIPFVYGDPVRLRQVIWNVLHNAVRNTPRGGAIQVRSANPTADALEVTVRDTGRGIDFDVLPRIFNLFEQADDMRRRGVGLGLGLSITKDILEAHGGRITAASDGAGRGATFTIELRALSAPTPVIAGEPAPTQPAAARGTGTVLLVEDNIDSATALAELLRIYGYEVIVAGSMHEALQAVERADILISDIGLPDGSGLELMRAICTRRPIPAIALSGYGTADDLRRSAEAGFERHIVKPVEPAYLLEALQHLAPT